MQSKYILSAGLFIFGIYAIYRGIRAIITRNLYWTAPTISGFKNRKQETEPLWVAMLTGISTMIFGIFIIYVSIMVFIHSQ